MQGWRVTRPSDVVELNRSVFRAVIRKFALVLVLMVPMQIGMTLLAAHERFPSMSVAHTLSIAVPFFLVGFGTHYGLVFVGLVFFTAIGSLVWWRELLAIGRPSPLFAALAVAVRRVVRRLSGQLATDIRAMFAHRSRATHDRPEPTFLDQLCAALCCAPTAPPLQLALIADRAVRLDQLTPRRVS